MSKVAAYLRGHISGEVTSRDDVREALSTDTGVLKIKPELVVYPRSTNDIRKVARFTWQLAEKGHVMPLTVRGAGSDGNGAAIGHGVLLVTPAHMNHIFEYDPKQRLARLQPGVTIGELNAALSLYGTRVMSLTGSLSYGTVGGAIASAVTGPYAGKYGTIERAIDQLEVVLANGDVIQTGRLNKKELNRKKGLQGFEGDIYRGIDGVIEEYSEVLDRLNANDATGYNTIADVKQRDGSFDLTPLFIGSQGTLGIISEMIMKATPLSPHLAAAALVFADGNEARDALDEMVRLQPTLLEYFDAALFDNAAELGHIYPFYAAATESIKPSSVVFISFDDVSAHIRAKNLKRLRKLYANRDSIVVTTEDGDPANELLTALDVTYYTRLPDRVGIVAPRLYEGFHVPTARLEEFVKALATLATHLHVPLPMAGHVITNTYSIYPALPIENVADKQKVIKLLDELTKHVYAHDGTMIAEGGEGRLKGRSIYPELDEQVRAMYDAIRKVCDPFGTLNPGVKQTVEVTALAQMLRHDHLAGQFARYNLD